MLNFEKCTPEERDTLCNKLGATMVRINGAKEEINKLWLEYFESAHNKIDEIGYHRIQSALDNISDLLSASLLEFSVMSGYTFDGWDEDIVRIFEGMKLCLADLGKNV